MLPNAMSKYQTESGCRYHSFIQNCFTRIVIVIMKLENITSKKEEKGMYALKMFWKFESIESEN